LFYLLTGHGDFDDNLRMVTNCGVKFAGRTVYQWGREEGGAPAIPKKLERAKANAVRIHAADPEVILQASIFEIATSGCATRGNGFARTTPRATCRCQGIASSPEPRMANAGTT
jgi:hypothetical protein